MKSKYQLGWIGLRVSRAGHATSKLKREGWIKTDHAQLNNRNAFDWLRPVKTKEQFQNNDWTELANAGLEAVAIWFTDAQWKFNAELTDLQWRDRRIIEAQFNSQWPKGSTKI